MALTTIATFRTIPEAYIAKAVLDDAGLPSFVADDGIVSWLVGIPNLLGGVKLQVSERDAQHALELLSRPVAEGDGLDEGEDVDASDPPEES